MSILVTGVAGFIGMHVATALLGRGEQVLGVDNLNAYYDVDLKKARLAQLSAQPGFTFLEADIADAEAMKKLADPGLEIDRIVHLAAQPGVRYSLENPRSYIDNNIVGQLNILELARQLGRRLAHLVYASSSSVYGGNSKLPFAVADRVDHPISLYAATKKADELMGHAYSHIYGLPMTGLRFFTVYGPWGRPDMSPYIFASKIAAGLPIPVFNQGDMQRDFTYIDDIATGVVAALERPPGPPGDSRPRVPIDAAPQRIYNLGNNKTVELMYFISLIEAGLGKKAEIEFQAMQPGDVKATYADIEASRKDLGFAPQTPIEDGVVRFISWFKEYHRV